MGKRRGPTEKKSKHDQKLERINREQLTKNSNKNNKDEQVIDGESFDSGVEKAYKKHTSQLSKVAGNKDYDSDEDLIQPLIPTHSDDDEDVENVEDVESDDEIQMIPQKKKTMNNTDQDDDESDDDESSDEDEDAKESIGKVSSNQWKKSDYYQQQKQQQQQNNKKKSNNSQYDERQEQYEQDEEAEVLEIQKKRASRLNNQYVLDDLLLSDSQNKKKNKKQKTDESDDEQQEEEDDDEQQQQQQMNKNQKMKLIMKESPELIQLFTELKDRLQVVRDQIHPILSKVESQEYATRDGLSYLETKLHLLLSYCTHILYYMLLKTSGKSVRDHPVIEKLVEMRLYLEKMKPIDDRMKSQIAKLISLVNDAVPIPSTTTTTSSATKLSSSSSSSSSSAHKPRPGQLVGEKDGDDDDESSTDDEHVEESDDDETMADDFNGGEDDGENGGEESDDESDDETNVYTAPKLMPVAYDNASVKKAKSDMKRLEKKIRNSEMIKAFKAEMGDEPEEMTNIGSEIKQSSLLKDREDYETETFTRRNLTKKEKRMLRDEQDRTVDELRNLESFTDIQALEKYSKAKNTTNTKVTLAQYMGDADKAEEDLSKMNGEGSDDDNDVDNQLDEDEQFLRASGVITEYSDSDFDEEEEDEEEEEEAPVVKSKNNNKVGDKRKRIESMSNNNNNNNNKKKKRSTIRDEEDAMLESEYSGTGKRAATKEIVENKGLVSRKKKDYKNPRVKHKMRFANKAGSMLKMQKVQKGGQTGSVKSVNKSVVRSKKLRA